MSALELEVVGCAMATPLGAPCSSYLVRGGGTTVLLDCGPGALPGLWERGALAELDAIVVSHMHQDHVLDLVPLSNAMTQEVLAPLRGARGPIALHVPREGGPEVLEALAAAVGEPGRFAAGFALHTYAPPDRLRLGELELTFAATGHRGPCFAIRVGLGDVALVYGADSPPSAALEEHCRGADLVVLEASALDPSPDVERFGHMTADQAAGVAARAGAGRLVLTHLSPWLDGEDARKQERARSRFPGPVDLARPGAVFRA
ncbi:MBL fold metallo-hydrolase [Conexibacter sp. SYSU D00693]|uniref:MBL fold metallo-hydrolase n=1 Tax=Conexibacter sp. SYSU D00693 TaxID=2812560 RepID=UPI00196A292E|nr:MBL fold metallo-hydrolase [Conexibacter sp. SYSU D00693]